LLNMFDLLQLDFTLNLVRALYLRN
jgi:hypothetical protein